MNMKKSLAGVMAGALAVSAMATTASAWSEGDGSQEQILLSYDLNTVKDAWSDGVVSLRYTYAPRTNNPYVVEGLKDGGSVDVYFGTEFKAYNSYRIDTVTITGTGYAVNDLDNKLDQQGTGRTYSKSFSPYNKDSGNGKNDIVQIWSGGIVKDANGNYKGINIPFTANGTNLDSFPMDGMPIPAGTEGGVYEPWEAANVSFPTEDAAKKSDAAKDFPVVVADPDNTTTYTWSYKPANTVTAGIADTNYKATYADADYTASVASLAYTVANKTAQQAAADAVVAAQTTVDGSANCTTKPAAGAYLAVKVIDDTANSKLDIMAVPAAGDAVPGTNVANEAIPREETNKAVAEQKYNADVALVAANTDGTASITEMVVADAPTNKYYLQTEDGKYTYGTSKYTPETAVNKGYGFKNYEVVLTYYVNGNDWDGAWRLDKWAVNNESKGITGMQSVNYVANLQAGSHTTYSMPLKSTWNEPADVLARITENGYTLPQAVLNDVIANNENVQFEFTTSQKYIDTRDWVKLDPNAGEIPVGDPYDYKDATLNKTYKASKIRIKNPAGALTTIENVEIFKIGDDVYARNPYRGVAYDANKNDDFNHVDNALWYHPRFSQDLYQSFTWGGKNGYVQFGPAQPTDKDQYGSYSGAWNNNLTSAGLVVNSRWTMQLSDVTAFEWGDQTISFLWDAVKDQAVTNASNFLQSMQLYTPTEWYWEKLDVKVGAAITEEVAVQAPLEEEPEEVTEAEVETEEEIIEEEEPIEDDFEEPIEDEPFEEEPEVFDEPVEDETEPEVTEPEVTEPIEVEVVESPKTGNASVALAVIPVALAAAAVVAKKRK